MSHEQGAGADQREDYEGKGGRGRGQTGTMSARQNAGDSGEQGVKRDWKGPAESKVREEKRTRLREGRGPLAWLAAQHRADPQGGGHRGEPGTADMRKETRSTEWRSCVCRG